MAKDYEVVVIERCGECDRCKSPPDENGVRPRCLRMEGVRETPEVAFLRAIVDAPDDDLPRLVYADWLDENAAGNPAEELMRARAEFIRLSILLYQYENSRGKPDGYPDGRAARKRWVTARRKRLAELWDDYAYEFAEGLPGGKPLLAFEGLYCSTGRIFGRNVYRFIRGFAERQAFQGVPSWYKRISERVEMRLAPKSIPPTVDDSTSGSPPRREGV